MGLDEFLVRLATVQSCLHRGRKQGVRATAAAGGVPEASVDLVVRGAFNSSLCFWQRVFNFLNLLSSRHLGWLYLPAPWKCERKFLYHFLLVTIKRYCTIFCCFFFPLWHWTTSLMLTSIGGGSLSPWGTKLSTATCWPTVNRKHERCVNLYCVSQRALFFFLL